MKLNDPVYDYWWPWRIGIIIKKTRYRLHIKWCDGEIWAYDSAHVKFLKPCGIGL